MIERFFSILLLNILCILYANAQYITNPSFEGTANWAVSPPNWEPCGDQSTPDTQPGYFGVKFNAKDGKTFLGMVCRGEGYNNWEAIQQKLPTSLLKDQCYHLDIFLTYYKDFFAIKNWDDTVWYNKQANLRIWGSTDSCTFGELLWQSAFVNEGGWLETPYNARITPQLADVKYLVLEAYYIDNPKYFGNILIDLISITDTVILETSSQEVSEGSLIELRPSHYGDYFSWTPEDGLSCLTCGNPTVTIDSPKSFSVQIIDSFGCIYMETFEFTLKLEIPNVFTPNNDFKNDYFKIKGLKENSSLKIYNRWGELIFYNPNYQNNWDGYTLSGKEAPEGTYFYVLHTESNVIKRGFFELLR